MESHIRESEYILVALDTPSMSVRILGITGVPEEKVFVFVFCDCSARRQHPPTNCIHTPKNTFEIYIYFACKRARQKNGCRMEKQAEKRNSQHQRRRLGNQRSNSVSTCGASLLKACSLFL